MVNQIPEVSVTTKLFRFKQLFINPNSQEIINLNLDNLWLFFKRTIYKISRIIYRIPVLKWLIDLVYEARVAQYRKLLPELNAEDRVILETLQKTGSIAIPIEDLRLTSTESFLQKTLELVEYQKNIPSQDRLLIDLEPHKFQDCPEVFLWGIEPRFLDIIEHYIGLPIYYQGYSMRRDIVNQASDSTCIRNWHLDAEDRTVIKIIIYLNDVGVDGGCYEYITKNLTKKAVKKLNYDIGYLSDQTMMDIIPQQDWSNCIGKIGTVIISDTSSVFHRAKPPEKEDRLSISFCYTSNKPKFYWYSQSFFPKNLSEIYQQLNQKQRNVLINKNKFFSIKL